MFAYFDFKGKIYKIHGFRTKTEKSLMLLNTENLNLDFVLEHLGFLDFNTELTDKEKMIIIYKYREISISDLYDIKHKCSACGLTYQAQVKFGEDEFIRKPKSTKYKDKWQTVTDDNLHLFFSSQELEDLENLPLLEYENVLKEINDSQTTLNFLTQVQCLKCGVKNKINMENKDFMLSSLSQDTLQSLYQTYNDLIYYSNFTKTDIDEMLPFEREVFLQLLIKTKKNEVKGVNSGKKRFK